MNIAPILIGGIVGCAGTIIVLVGMSGSTEEDTPVREEPSCAISILLWETSDAPLSKAIDAASGELGFSHASCDACEVDAEGHPLMVDCTPEGGVFRRRLDAGDYEGRKFVRVVLQGGSAREFYGCLRAKIGQPFDPVGMLGGAKTGAAYCSHLIYQCLPSHLRKRVDVADGAAISPNDLARAFGIDNPTSKDVVVS